jgi:hypothetical protein
MEDELIKYLAAQKVGSITPRFFWYIEQKVIVISIAERYTQKAKAVGST